MSTFRSSRVLVGDELRPASVRIEDGVFVEIGEFPTERDFGDLVVLPGLVDSHVHVNEPGRTDWEGFETATMAAAAGGATTIVDMPLNSIPPTTTVPGLEEKQRAAEGKLSVDVAFWGGVVPGSEHEVEALEAAGVCGFKVFMVDSGVPEFAPLDVKAIARLDTSLPLLVHAEDASRFLAPGPGYSEYLASRPPDSEAAAIKALVEAGVQGHVLHVSSAQAVDELRRSRGRLSGETCPHYLFFSAEDVTGTEFKCAPPIREAHHRDALWDALAEGVLSMVVSDHSPSPPGMKRGGFDTAWGGIASLQLRLPLVWTEGMRRGFDLVDVARWLAAAPAALAGLVHGKGAIEEGVDADFVVFDPDATWTVDGASLFHRHSVTPYQGVTLHGDIVETQLRGEVVYDGENVKVGTGTMLRRR